VQEHKLILIVYYGRSGSGFIHSLLDSHPSLISMPPVLMKFYMDLKTVKPDLTSAQSAYNFFIDYYGAIINVFTQKPEQEYVKLKFREFNCDGNLNVDAGVFEGLFKTFFEQLEKDCSDPQKRLFLCMHYAFDAMLNNYVDISIAKNKKIVFQLHNPLFAQIFWFSNITDGAYLLQMVRSPLVALRSILKHVLEHVEQGTFKFTPLLMLKHFKQILFGATQFPYGNVDHFAIKLEDLHCSPEEILGRLAQRLNIAWHPNLLKSTFSNQPWGNVQNREHISGFSPLSVKIDVSDIFPEKDMSVLCRLMSRRYNAWDYELPILNTLEFQLEEEHYFLIEYLSYINDFDKALNLYKNQIPIIRSNDMRFFLKYAEHFDEPYVGTLK
jgi:hypothetical protein